MAALCILVNHTENYFLTRMLVKSYLLHFLSAVSPSHKATNEHSTVVKDTEKELEAEQEEITSL